MDSYILLKEEKASFFFLATFHVEENLMSDECQVPKRNIIYSEGGNFL